MDSVNLAQDSVDGKLGAGRPGNRGFTSEKRKRFFFSPERPHRFLGPSSLQLNKYAESLSWGKSGRNEKLTTYVPLSNTELKNE